MEGVGLEETAQFGVALLGAIMLGFVANGVFLASRGALPVPLRMLGVVSVLLGLSLGNVCANGGILRDEVAPEDRPEVQPPADEAAAPVATS